MGIIPGMPHAPFLVLAGGAYLIAAGAYPRQPGVESFLLPHCVERRGNCRRSPLLSVPGDHSRHGNRHASGRGDQRPSGLPGTWIDTALRDEARTMGYTVVDADTVVAMPLNHLITLHAAELQQLIDHLGKESPKLTLQKVQQNLLAEGIHIHDMRTIVETMAENASHHQDAGAAGVRPAARHASRFLRRSLPQLKLLSHADTGLEEHQGDGAGGWAGVRAGKLPWRGDCAC